MTIRLKLGLSPLQTLSKIPSPGSHWANGPPHAEASSLAELSDLNSLKLQYTSLRDLIPLSPSNQCSPMMPEADWCDISKVRFKDELLKQAARAYLQPSGVKTTPKVHFFTRCLMSLSNRNKALGARIKQYFQGHIKTCLKFCSTQACQLLQQFKPQYAGFLRNKAA